jgi:hypothetical protein
MTRAHALELTGLAIILAAQGYLFAQPIHSAVNYDEAVYLAAVDALRHGQSLGTDVFAAQFPGFYDLLRGLSFLTGIGVASLRAGLLGVTLVGTIGGWLVGRRYGGPVGGLLVASLLAIAPPLDLFGFQVIADTPALALTVLALGLATLAGPTAAVLAGVAFAAALSVKLTAITALPPLLLLVRHRLKLALAGFAAVALGLLAAHIRALGSLWAGAVSYHTDARGTPAVIPHPHRQILDQIPRGTPFFVIAVSAAVVGAVFFLRRRSLGVWPLWTWVALGVVFLFLHAPLHYNHLVIFPFSLAVAAGATIGAAVERVPDRMRLACCALLAVAIGAGWVQQLHRVNLVTDGEPQSNIAAAAALARLTPPGSRTIDDRPIISFLANRRVDGALVDLALLRFETGSLTDAKVIHELPSVDAVVVSRVLARRPAVMRFLNTHYKLRYARGGVRIYTRP